MSNRRTQRASSSEDEKEEASSKKARQDTSSPSLRMIFSRSRSNVLSTKWMVATSQPLASAVGASILNSGGNACDAAVAIAAALAVTEPCSTGLGGDMFALFYDAKQKRVMGINGSGRAGSKGDIESVRKILPGESKIPRRHGLAVTVPGCVAGWDDALRAWGTMSMSQVLAPAIKLAEQGFPVSEVTAHWWKIGLEDVDKDSCFSPAPEAGSIFKNPDLGKTLRAISIQGKQAFYEGEIAKVIADTVRERGGVLDENDLRAHRSTLVEPIKTRYRDKVDIYECPPNGQGIVALMALDCLNRFPPPSPTTRMSAETLHLMIECVRTSFADARLFVADPEHMTIAADVLLQGDDHVKRRMSRIDPKVTHKYDGGRPLSGSDTVSFQVVDSHGNAISFVNSTYEGFGSGICPPGLGISLQNRGCNFNLDPKSANRYDGNKRPYHTIIPGMALNSKDRSLFASFTIMGGFNQPQAHLQVISNLIDLKEDPQRALDRPRFCVLPTDDDKGFTQVALEEGIDEETVEKLKTQFGHPVRLVKGYDRALFGRGQIILKQGDVLIAGSDVRADGCALPGF